jgi:hypothetical protein
MAKKGQFDDILGRLSSGGAIRCQELADMLALLGFEVRDGKKTGHKVFVHHGVQSFTSGGYTCGHGRNPEIKPVYIRKVVTLLKQYKTELIQHTGEDS